MNASYRRDTLAEQIEDAREQIEARLLLGGAATDAFAVHRRGAARTALLPAIDFTKVLGLISLPGAMTRLILDVDRVDEQHRVDARGPAAGCASRPSRPSPCR